jgi:L-alanine-DL-glutamate epimerase-like enolase superfamily enzyme
MIRLDANGAFHASDVLDKLNEMAPFGIHSIEQPVEAGQPELMGELCRHSPIAIALDEELIGVNDLNDKKSLLDIIGPQYIILKPTLHGGFEGCEEWIDLAHERSIGWWATSALESNIGLNAIAQWVASKNPSLAQGLGTGSLFNNNIPSPLTTVDGNFRWDEQLGWDVSSILLH